MKKVQCMLAALLSLLMLASCSQGTVSETASEEPSTSPVVESETANTADSEEKAPEDTVGEPEESSGSNAEEGASEEPSVDYYEYDGYRIYNDLDDIIDPTEIESYTSQHQLFTLIIPEEYREWLLIGTSLEAGEDEMSDGVILLVKPALEKQETLIGGGWGTYAAVIWAVKTDSDQFSVVSQSTDETPVAEVGEYSYFIMEHASEMRAVLGETADTEYANLLTALDEGIDSWVQILP